MTTIESVIIEADDVGAAEDFYARLGLIDPVEVRAADLPTGGFRGFVLSLVVSRPPSADAFVDAARAAGAEVLREPSKSLWGYGGAFRAPDGTAWSVASSSKKGDGPATLEYDDLVLLLGVDDVKASKHFYTERGFDVAKSFGAKYVELDTTGIKLALQPRRAAAKTIGIDAEGTGSHRLAVAGDAGRFTDPDGFVWTEQPGRP